MLGVDDSGRFLWGVVPLDAIARAGWSRHRQRQGIWASSKPVARADQGRPEICKAVLSTPRHKARKIS